MLHYVPAVIALLLLVILFRYLPGRVFFIFAFLTAIMGGVLIHTQTANRAEPPLTQERLAAMNRDQELFVPWWNDYQKGIGELDRCWTRYHQILADAKNGESDIRATHARLSELERDMQDLRARMDKNVPPVTLSDEIYNPVASIVVKTDAYVAAEQKAVTLTRAAADPAAMQEKKPAEQARLLELVMLRESPVALFIEDEIGAVRKYLAPVSSVHRDERMKPDETTKKTND
jgi:hypothetical protein